MLYLDTSLLVAAHTHERATQRAIRFLETRQEPVAISEWVYAEFAAVLSIKTRTQEIDDATRQEAWALFSESVQHSMGMLTVASTHFRAAAKLAGDYELGLRAADALHLAIASQSDATLCTMDRRLAKAGKTLGVATKLV